jgi:hypothetical protein
VVSGYAENARRSLLSIPNIFSFAKGRFSMKVCIGVLPWHLFP